MAKNNGPTKLTDKQEIRGKGQPRTFKNADAFYNMAKSYILMCKDEAQLANIAGFCVYCDMHKDTYYQQQEYYSDSFKKVEALLESAALNHSATAMGIFYLKNKFGYRDKIETENINLNHEMTEEEADEILKRFK
jgi:hypothetical protein